MPFAVPQLRHSLSVQGRAKTAREALPHLLRARPQHTSPGARSKSSKKPAATHTSDPSASETALSAIEGCLAWSPALFTPTCLARLGAAATPLCGAVVQACAHQLRVAR